MKKMSVRYIDEMKILISVSVIKALDLKVQNKHLSYEEIVPKVLKSIKFENEDCGILILASASRALKYYDAGSDYKETISRVLNESDELIGLLES